jgi:SpoVK/Ycf46/Vps4 family AAA+-type ATPase
MERIFDSEVLCLLLKESDITEGVLGGSSDNMAMAFERARSEQPAVLIFEELDAIAPKREEDDMNHGYRSIVNELLAQVNEIRDEDVFCVGTTNLLGNIDPALQTTHRFDTVHVGLPDAEARADIFRHYLSERVVELEKFDCERLARMTEGFTGSNIEQVTENAARRVSKEYAEGDRDDYIVHKTDVWEQIDAVDEE